jgi:hypothetical protein
MLWGIGNSYAAPPTLDVKPALSDSLLTGHWQPVIITLKNPDTGTPLQGEVQISLEETRSGVILDVYTQPVILPRGAGTVQTTAYIYLPEGSQPVINLYLINGREGKGEMITRKRFDKIPLRFDALNLLAVTQQPDSLAYLQAETFAVYPGYGVLRPALAPRQRGGVSQVGTSSVVQVQLVPDPANLPDRSLGYDLASIIYIGADISPDTLADAQVTSLKQWVQSGGVLVYSGAKLRTDERFRAWLPPYQATTQENSDLFRVSPQGRGFTVALNFDPTSPGFGESPAALATWKKIVTATIGTPSLGLALSETDGMFGYYGYSFFNSVMHAPGLKAPGIDAIGLYLLGYIVLLIPLNYFILKRLDKREWAWFTVPLLVALFTIGAYSFGLSIKGGDTILNTASVVELTEGEKQAHVFGVVGLFSPSLSRYRIGVDLPGAVLWSAKGQYGGGGKPLVLEEGNKEGGAIRNVEVPMWSMDTFGVRASTLTLGEGIRVNLKEIPRAIPDPTQDVTGTIENRTGKTLYDVRIGKGNYSTAIGKLEPGQTAKVKLKTDVLDSRNPYYDLMQSGTNPNTSQPRRTGEIAATQQAIGQDLRQAIRGVVQNLGSQEYVQVRTAPPYLISAWNYDPLLPVTINKEKPQVGGHANLIMMVVNPD